MLLFWLSGIFKFIDSHDEIKECILDSFKDLLIAIMIIPLWYFISGNMENEVISCFTIFVHFCTLTFVFCGIKYSIKSKETVSSFTYGVVPIIAFIFVCLGIPLSFSIVIALVLPGFINYTYASGREERRNS